MLIGAVCLEQVILTHTSTLHAAHTPTINAALLQQAA